MRLTVTTHHYRFMILKFIDDLKKPNEYKSKHNSHSIFHSLTIALP